MNFGNQPSFPVMNLQPAARPYCNPMTMTGVDFTNMMAQSVWESQQRVQAEAQARLRAQAQPQTPPLPGPGDIHRQLQPPGELVKINQFTGQPELAEGIYEVWRTKIGNIFLKHYGILLVVNGRTYAYDLQVTDGPREGISFQDFAEGREVRWTLRFPPGVGMKAAVDRLEYAIKNFREWLPFRNNCEHWARFVSRNERISGQSNGIGIVAACLVVGAIFAAGN